MATPQGGSGAGHKKFMMELPVPGKHTKFAATFGMNLFLAVVCQASGQHYFISPQSETQDSQADAHLQRGLQLAQAGELPSAENELRIAVKLKPDDAEAVSSLATILAIEKRLEESTSLFERALKLSPTDLRSRRHLAANLYQLRRYSEARQNLKVVLKAEPSDPQARLLLGLISEKTGDYATAVSMLKSFPGLASEQPEAEVALAKSYYLTGEAGKAAHGLQALASGPLGAQGALLGAQVADEMGDYATAESLVNGVPADSASFSAAKYRLAIVKFHTKQYEESERILQGLIGAGSRNGEILRLLAWCYHNENRDEEAIRTFREAVQLDPKEERNYLDLGALLLEQRKFSVATEFANRTVNAFPASANALVLLGSVEFASEQFAGAVKTYSRALTLDRSDEDAILGLAKAQAAAGMSLEAKATLEDAMKHFPGKASFELQLALLLLKENGENGNSQARAESLLQTAAKHDPMLGEAQYQLGELALRRGQTAVALTYLESAVRLSPDSARVHFALARGYRRAGRAEEAARETGVYEKLKKVDTFGTTSPPANVPPGD
ncbi:MAG TPA: tetratricopeptide repeat protein [Candidatus Saccharimonadales bacterium]|nr:tetratricopeptide repeat protein [Candidatus Saccharimonadales bacterium]